MHTSSRVGNRPRHAVDGRDGIKSNVMGEVSQSGIYDEYKVKSLMEKYFLLLSTGFQTIGLIRASKCGADGNL